MIDDCCSYMNLLNLFSVEKIVSCIWPAKRLKKRCVAKWRVIRVPQNNKKQA